MASANEEEKPVASSSTTPPVVEYKKDGTVSRIRSHKGNIPQLPQTKLCPFCPAKFTRTTHLNRHLRNHTNERSYRCETCGAQFTRSDLLARHKRSCGESHPITRSRRRSCQACAALKVKCDLKQPCSKCTARNRKCVYTAEETAEEGQAGSPSGPSRTGIANLDASAGFDPSTLTRASHEAFAAAFPELTLIEETSNAIAQPLSMANVTSFTGMRAAGQALSLPTDDGGSTANTMASFQPRNNRAFMSELGGPTGNSNLSSFSSAMFEPFFRDVFAEPKTSPRPTPPLGNDAAPPMVSAPESVPSVSLQGLMMPNGMDDAFMENGSGEAQPFMAEFDNELLYDMITNTYAENPSFTEPAKPEREFPAPYPGLAPATEAVLYTQEEVARQVTIPPPVPVDPGPPEPTLEELQQYLYVFLTAFLPQIPIIHTPSLRVELKPPILLRAMQACGALFVKTRTAEAFVERTLSTSREVLVREFAKPSPDPKHQVHIIMTLILLQMVGLFHQDPQQRASSNIYHGMLVLMIRQNRIIERSASWTHQTFPTVDPTTLDATWRDWAVHEAIKRAVCIAYCHDQSHRIYFALPSSFLPSEFSLHLPVDDAVWTAPTAYAWSQILITSSPYGDMTERIMGVPMPLAFAAVGLEGPATGAAGQGTTSPPKDPGVISPFGHFIIVHALLGELFRRCSTAASPASIPSPDDGAEEQVNEHVFAMQLALHRWLQLWLNSPDGPNKPAPKPADCPSAGTPPVKDAPFTADPLPFYWLAQLLLLAFQEGLPPFGPRPQTKNSPGGQSASPSLYSPSIFAPSPFTNSSSSSSSLSPPPAYTAGLPMLHASDHYYRTPTQPDAAASQFTLIKGWLHHIRLFLRRSQGSPTVVWDELMKIRLQGWAADSPQDKKASEGAQGDEAEGGLLGFFEEKLKL